MNEEDQDSVDNGKKGRQPDFLLYANAIPPKGQPFERNSVRVGAAWINNETKTISITIDRYVVLKGEPYDKVGLVLLLNKKGEKYNELKQGDWK